MLSLPCHISMLCPKNTAAFQSINYNLKKEALGYHLKVCIYSIFYVSSHLHRIELSEQEYMP